MGTSGSAGSDTKEHIRPRGLQEWSLHRGAGERHPWAQEGELPWVPRSGDLELSRVTKSVCGLTGTHLTMAPGPPECAPKLCPISVSTCSCLRAQSGTCCAHRTSAGDKLVFISKDWPRYKKKGTICPSSGLRHLLEEISPQEGSKKSASASGNYFGAGKE